MEFSQIPGFERPESKEGPQRIPTVPLKTRMPMNPREPNFLQWLMMQLQARMNQQPKPQGQLWYEDPGHRLENWMSHKELEDLLDYQQQQQRRSRNPYGI